MKSLEPIDFDYSGLCGMCDRATYHNIYVYTSCEPLMFALAKICLSCSIEMQIKPDLYPDDNIKRG